MSNIRKILELTDSGDLKGFILLVFLSLITIVLETLSIGMVIPLVSIIIEPNFLINYKDTEIGKFIPSIFYNFDHSAILFLVLIGFALIFLLKNLYVVFFSYVAALYSNRLKAKLTNRLLDKYLFQDYLFHLNKKYSNFVANLTTETSLLTNGILLPLLTLFTEVLLIIMIVILITYLQLYKVIAIFGLFALVGIILLKLTKKYFSIWGALRENQEKIRIGSLNKLLSGIRDIILIGKKKSLLDKFNFSENNIAKYSVNQNFLYSVPKNVFETMGVFGLVGSILFLNYIGSSTFEILTAASFFIAASYRMIPSLNKIVNSYQSIKFHAPVLNLLKKEFSLPNKIDYSEDKIEFLKELKITNLSFKYPGTEKNVLSNLNLSIKKGSITGIVGKTGSGKSTLIDIISGLIQSQSGQMIIDNVIVDNQKILRQWQNNLSYVSQNTYLMDDTIKNNIAFGLNINEINDNLLNSVLKDAELEGFINTLPKKINSYVGDRGVSLSGGQIQRIGIARALYRKSEFLILDEITSALDKETENKIIGNILKNKKDQTILIITHNLDLLKYCDAVYKIQDQTISKIEN